MKKQMIVADDNIKRWNNNVNKALKEGWVVMPETIKIVVACHSSSAPDSASWQNATEVTKELCVVVLEKTE